MHNLVLVSQIDFRQNDIEHLRKIGVINTVKYVYQH